MPRPTYLSDDVARTWKQSRFTARTDRDLWAMAFQLNSEAQINGLSSLVTPERPTRPADTLNLEPDPLPVVVSPQPGSRDRQQQSPADVLGEEFRSWRRDQQPAQMVQEAGADATPSAAGIAGTQPAATGGVPAAMPTGQASAGYGPSSGRGAEGVEQWSDLIAEAARAYNLPEATIKGLMEIESGGRTHDAQGRPLRSAAGATSLMQVMPFHFGPDEDPDDPRTNIMKGAKIYADALRRYGDPDKAAAAYFGAIDANGNITGATDATGTDGHHYVRLWRAAAAKYGATPPNAGAAAPPSAPAVPSSSPATGVQPTPAASGSGGAVTVRDQWGNTFQTTMAQLQKRPGGYADLTILSGPDQDMPRLSLSEPQPMPEDASLEHEMLQQTGRVMDRKPPPLRNVVPWPDTESMLTGDLPGADGLAYRAPLLPTDPEASTGQAYDPRDADSGAREQSAENAHSSGQIVVSPPELQFDPDAGPRESGYAMPPSQYGQGGDDPGTQPVNPVYGPEPMPGPDLPPPSPPARIQYPNERQLAPAYGRDTGVTYGPAPVPAEGPSRWSPESQAQLAPTAQNPDIVPPPAAPLPGTPTLPGNTGRYVTEEINRAGQSQTQQIDPLQIMEIVTTSLPIEVVNEILTQQVTDGEWKQSFGTDPLAPFRGAAARYGVTLPSAQEINPDNYPASSIWGGLVASLLLPDPTDPIVGAGLRNLGRGARAVGLPAAAGAAGALAGAATPGPEATLGERADAALAAGASGFAAGLAPRAAPAVGRAAGRAGYALAEEGARQLMDLTPQPRIVPPSVARQIPGGVRLPPSPLLAEAAENTPGTSLTPDGLEMDVQRFQRPKDAGQSPSSGGVFYGPDAGPGRSPYRIAAEDPDYPPMYGGTQEVRGRTLLQRPFIETGADSRETLERLAVEAGRSPDEASEMVFDFMAMGRRRFSEEAYNALARQYGIPEILPGRGSPELRVYEGLRAALARQAGYDSVVRVSQLQRHGANGVTLDPPKIAEIHDLREATYPTPEGGYTLRPEFQPANPLDAPGVRYAGSGFVPDPGRPARPTVEVLQQRLDAAWRNAQRARAAGDAEADAIAMERVAELQSALVDAQNARRALEPAITSDVGRRLEDLPLDERSADDLAGIGREAVRPVDAADLGGPVGVPVDMDGRGNATFGTLPASASADDQIATANRALGQGVMSVFSGGTAAAAADQMGDPNDPNRKAKAFVAGALGPMLGAKAIAKIVGSKNATRLDDAALATLGNIPPSPQGRQIAQNVARQAARQNAPQIINGQVVAASSKPANLLEIAQAYRHSIGMLGNIGTGLLNAMGGPVSMADALAVDVVRQGLLKGYPVPAIMEAGSLVTGLKDAAVSAFNTSIGRISPAVRAAPDFRPPLAERIPGAAGKVAGHVIDAPGRLMTQTPDAFFSTLFENMGRRRAANEIMMESGVSRLDPAAQIQEVQRLLNNPTPAEAQRIDEAAKKFSDEYTYKGKAGYWEDVFSKPFRPSGGKPTTANDTMARQIHDLAGSFVMPFYGSIFKIHKLAGSHIPLVGTALNRDLPYSEKVARQLVGLGFGLWVADLAAKNLVTGPGPDDPDEKARLKATGWDEWSTYLPGIGYTKTDNLAQAAPIIKPIAAYYDAQRYRNPNQQDALKQGDKTVKTILRAFEDFPTVQAVQAVKKMVADSPIEGAADLGITIGSSFVPALVRASVASQDPYQRAVDTNAPLAEQIRQRAINRVGSIPGVGTRQDLPPALNRETGEPIPNPRQGAGAFIPQPRVTKDDPLMAELAGFGVYLDKPRTSFTVTAHGSDAAESAPGSRDVKLTPSMQQEWLQYRRQQIDQTAAEVKANPEYQRADDTVKKKVWDAVVRGAEKYADGMFKADEARWQRMVDEAPPKVEPRMRRVS